MLKTLRELLHYEHEAYHLGEGRVLKTDCIENARYSLAYHLGEGRVLKTGQHLRFTRCRAYHLGEGRVLKT